MTFNMNQILQVYCKSILQLIKNENDYNFE